jgi:NAD(P) transhydrogenase subunit alpha
MTAFPKALAPAFAFWLLMSTAFIAHAQTVAEPRAPVDSGELIDAPLADSNAEEIAEAEEIPEAKSRRQGLMASLTIFVLAIFVGFEVITKVPPTLHTPLMSGSNAISGITLVGAVIVAGAGLGWFPSTVGMLAVALAAINVVGGFLVTHRMLAMFKKKR